MRRFRVVLIVLGVFLALGLIGGGLAFYLTRGPVAAADAFLEALADRGPEAAYAETAPAFRASSSVADFAAASGRLRLATFRSAAWSSRTITGSTADLEGTLSLADGTTIPVKMALIKDDAGIWRVTWLRVEGGTGTTPAPPAVPDAATCRQLAQVSFMQLAEAIHAHDFAALQAAGAADFRKQFTPEALAAQFKPFTDRNLDLTKAETTPVVLTGTPTVDQDGVLTVSGYVPVSGQNWYFQFGYAQDASDWRLVSLSLSSKAG